MSNNSQWVMVRAERRTPTCWWVWRGVGGGVWEPIKQLCLEAGKEAPPWSLPFLAYKDAKKRDSSEPTLV